MEAIYFDEGVRASKRQQLESKLLQVAPLSFIFDTHTSSIVSNIVVPTSRFLIFTILYTNVCAS
jgi:hypothetical protein